MADNYYEVLGLLKSCTEKDVKQAYRKLALRWHPDKNLDNKEEARIMFQKISEAYEVLSDPVKRHEYDHPPSRMRFGAGAAGSGSGSRRRHHAPHQPADFHSFHFHSPDDIFREFFGTHDPFEAFRTQMHRPSFANFDDFFSSPVHVHRSASQPMTHGSDFLFSFNTSMMDSPDHIMTFSSHDGSSASNFRSVKTSTVTKNGRRVKTTRVMENGRETVTVEENGRTKSVTVNGQLQPLQQPQQQQQHGLPSRGRASSPTVSVKVSKRY